MISELFQWPDTSCKIDPDTSWSMIGHSPSVQIVIVRSNTQMILCLSYSFTNCKYKSKVEICTWWKINHQVIFPRSTSRYYYYVAVEWNLHQHCTALIDGHDKLHSVTEFFNFLPWSFRIMINRMLPYVKSWLQVEERQKNIWYNSSDVVNFKKKNLTIRPNFYRWNWVSIEILVFLLVFLVIILLVFLLVW